MTNLPPNDDPPTARELAARSRRNGPWECPKCGCKDLRGEKNSSVESTRNPDGALVIRRKRICRHCGQHGITTEEVHTPPGFKLIVVPDEERAACA